MWASSSSAPPRSTYRVFLSFRGSDTRFHFCDFLYKDLLDSGLHTFRDDDEINPGGNIEAEIEKAISESEVGLIVFSQDFASSSYCLDEVVMLMERRRDFGITVIPVFYKVEPDCVSDQAGSFGDSFANHEKKLLGLKGEELRKERERLDGWRRALREVADLAGMVYRNEYQSKFIKKVVDEVINKANYVPLYVPSNLVGIDPRIKDINSWLQNGSTGVEVAVVCGIGGLGKTTITKIAFNQNFRKFDKCSFLANVRETLEQFDGAVLLQRQLLSDIGSRASSFHSADGGIEWIRNSLGYKRVLIVLDDVDELDHFLNALIRNRDWLGSGSKIIITTRNKGLLESHNSVLDFVINPLDDNESLHLFSQHAFGQAYPIESYLRVCRRAVHLSFGLPLALEVFGSSLSGLNVFLWEKALTDLESYGGGKIQKVLWISYKSLEDDLDKNLFLDIACFFNGKPRDFVEKVVEGCDMYRRFGLERLKKRCLVSTDEYNRLVMHPLIRDMGRDIVGRESPNHGERSRLWFYQDAFRVLQRNKGTEKIRSLVLDQGHADISSTSAILLRTGALSKMSNLRFLHLRNVMFKGDFENFPNNLIWLFWDGFPLHCLPNNMFLDDVVVLSLQHSSLQYVWEEPQPHLENLKILDLSHCNMLVTTPDFKGLPSLEILNLEYCQNLNRIHESIGLLKKIVSINLKGCQSLLQLPMEISHLNSLKELILCGCSGLCRPLMLGKRKRSLVSRMETRLAFPVLPKFLVTLSLENCNLLDGHVPQDLSSLLSLEFLNLSFNPITALPESIVNLTSLHSLLLMGCERLGVLPKLPESILELNVMECKSLRRVESLPRSGRKLLWIMNCVNLVEIGDMFKRQIIGRSEITMIKELKLLDVQPKREHLWFWLLDAQVLYEFGIFNVFTDGAKIPSWYMFQRQEYEFSINPPHFEGHKIIGLNLCVLVLLETVEDKPVISGLRVRVRIMNKCKHLDWIYSPSFFLLSRRRQRQWFSHWSLRDKLNGGDTVYVDVSIPKGIVIKMVGIHPVYDSKENSESSDSSGHSFVGKLDDPAYETSPGSGSYSLMHFPTPHVMGTRMTRDMDDKWLRACDAAAAYGGNSSTEEE